MTAHPRAEPRLSRYPAGGEGPRRVARRAEFAHSATGRSKTKKRKPKPGLHGNPARALLAYGAMQSSFYIAGTGLYIGEPYSYLWPFSQALAATVSVANIPGQAAKQAAGNSHEMHVRLYGLGKYWSTATSASEPLPGEQPEAEENGSEPSEGAGVPPPGLPSYSGNVVPPAGASYYDDNE